MTETRRSMSTAESALRSCNPVHVPLTPPDSSDTHEMTGMESPANRLWADDSCTLKKTYLQYMEVPMGSIITALSLIRKTATRLGPSYRQFGDEAERLANRLEQDRFMLAVIGQFKRGKSTLINALLGIPLLPSSVVPLTALPTSMEYGDRLRVTITFSSGDEIDNFHDSPEEAAALL